MNSFPINLQRFFNSSTLSVFLLCSIILSGTLLRIYVADITPLWIDEWNTWNDSSSSFSDILLWKHNPAHPPLSYFFTKLSIGIFGLSEWSLRLSSIIAGVFCVFFAYLIGLRISKIYGAVTFSLLVAFDPWQVTQSAQARMYTFGTLSILVFLFICFTSKDLIKRFGKKVYICITGISLAFAVWSSIFAIYLILAVLIFYIISISFTFFLKLKNKNSNYEAYHNILWSFAIAFILSLPGFISRISLVFSESGSTQHSFQVLSLWQDFISRVYPVAASLFINKELSLILYFTAFSILIVQVKFEYKWKSFLYVSALLLPVTLVFSLIISKFHPFVLPRYYLIMQIPVWISISIPYTWFSNSWQRLVYSVPIAILIIFSGAESTNVVKYNPGSAFGKQIQKLLPHLKEDDLVIHHVDYYKLLTELQAKAHSDNNIRKMDIDYIIDESRELKNERVWLVIGPRTMEGLKEKIHIIAQENNADVEWQPILKHVSYHRMGIIFFYDHKAFIVDFL